jgi:hypothetical protein
VFDIDRLIDESWKEFSQSEKQVSKVMANIMGLLKEYYARGYVAGHSRGYIDRMAEEQGDDGRQCKTNI